MSVPRRAEITRQTRETDIHAELWLTGEGRAEIRTGLAFFDHMLTALTTHSGIDLTLTCRGDLDVDDHHTIEDCGIVLGRAFDQALGDRAGIARFASAYAPLDESLSRAVVDFSGRPHAEVHLAFARPAIGAVATENLSHFFRSWATGARATLHIDGIRGQNDHHIAESAFKALALALREAVSVRGGAVPSTKGTLT